MRSKYQLGNHVVVFQGENKPSEILWKKMRDDSCAVMDRSLSAGSLAGMSSLFVYVKYLTLSFLSSSQQPYL